VISSTIVIIRTNGSCFPQIFTGIHRSFVFQPNRTYNIDIRCVNLCFIGGSKCSCAGTPAKNSAWGLWKENLRTRIFVFRYTIAIIVTKSRAQSTKQEALLALRGSISRPIRTPCGKRRTFPGNVSSQSSNAKSLALKTRKNTAESTKKTATNFKKTAAQELPSTAFCNRNSFFSTRKARKGGICGNFSSTNPANSAFSVLPRLPR